MKKSLSIISAIVFALSLTACDTSPEASGANSSGNSSSAVQSTENNNSSSGESVPVDKPPVESIPSTPSGTPTIFIGPDGNPIYDSEVTKIVSDYPDFNKKAAEITAEDEMLTIFCEGFQYFKEPGGVAYSSYENPELFDGAEFKGEIPQNQNSWKRVNVGDEICGLKLKSATSTFENYNKISYDSFQTYYTHSVPDFNLFAEFDGSITLTGYLNCGHRNPYEPDGGVLRFTPTENKLPIMPNGHLFKKYPKTYSVAQSYGGINAEGKSFYALNEINHIGINNPSELDLGCIGIGDTAFVCVTISDIKYRGGEVIHATLTDIEVLSDVLAHEEDTI